MTTLSNLIIATADQLYKHNQNCHYAVNRTLNSVYKCQSHCENCEAQALRKLGNNIPTTTTTLTW